MWNELKNWWLGGDPEHNGHKVFKVNGLTLALLTGWQLRARLQEAAKNAEYEYALRSASQIRRWEASRRRVELVRASTAVSAVTAE